MELTTHPRVWKVLAAIVAILVAVLLALMHFKLIFLTLVLGVALILLTERATEKYRHQVERYGFSPLTRWVYGGAVMVFWGVAGYALFAASVDELGSAMEQLAQRDRPIMATYLEHMRPYLPELLTDKNLTDEDIVKIQRDGLRILTRFLADLPGFFVNCLLIVPLMFYVYFGQRGHIAQGIIEAVPSRFRGSFSRAAQDVGTHLRGFFEAKIAESAVVGGICALGFFLAGIKGALALGLFAGFLNLIPYLGPVISAIPPIWITLAVDEPYVAIYVLITVIVAQIVDNFYLIPFMISGKVKVNPLLNIILILVGARLYGAVGMLFAVPTYLVFKTVIRDSYRELVRLHDPPRAVDTL